MRNPHECRYLRYAILALCTISLFIIFYTPPYILRPKEGWELNVTRQTKVYVVPNNETSLISDRDLCSDPDLNLMIVVCSAPANNLLRAAIRQTWANYNVSSVKVVFLLGLPQNASLQATIEEEHEEFHDIIQENFVDTYNNLTVKSLMMLKWFLNRCPSPHFLMKTDDDMFVNVSKLSALLSKLQPSSLLIGSLICQAKPILDQTSKWYIPKYMYSKSTYPNYLSGTAYVMSRDVAYKLYHTALTTALLHLEDVFITGVCAAKAGIKPHNHVSFNYQHVSVKCDPNIVTSHRMTPSDLHTLWSQRHNCTSAPSSHNSTVNNNLTMHANCPPRWLSKKSHTSRRNLLP